jgi:hypothetical protein
MSDETPLTPELVVGPLLHFRWDLDKTYLHTEFDTLRDLWRTFRQPADAKQNVAGARVLLRSLLEPERDDETRRRVTFISGSPRQMRRVLTEKLRLDGIEPDAFILKPNLSNLLRGRFRAMNDQVGYKLGALLDSRVDGPQVQELLFGDDAEADALIYSLYADLLSGEVSADRFAGVLAGTELYRSDIESLFARHATLRISDTARVARIFIRLDRRSPTARFDAFGARVVAIYNYYQAAVVLYADGRLSGPALGAVTLSMARDGYTPMRIVNSLHDLVRRAVVPHTDVPAIVEATSDALGHDAPITTALRAAASTGSTGPLRVEAPTSPIDYETLAATIGRYRRPRVRLPRVGPLQE